MSRCLEHQAEIEVWRATLSPDELMQINHPNVVWRKWNASVAKAKPEHAPRTSLKDEIVRLEHELSRAKANGGERFTAKDSARDIVTTLVLLLPPHKQTEIDALATLRPHVLRQIIADAVAPFFDGVAIGSRGHRARGEGQAR